MPCLEIVIHLCAFGPVRACSLICFFLRMINLSKAASIPGRTKSIIKIAHSAPVEMVRAHQNTLNDQERQEVNAVALNAYHRDQ